jgi:hypothetical protein
MLMQCSSVAYFVNLSFIVPKILLTDILNWLYLILKDNFFFISMLNRNIDSHFNVSSDLSIYLWLYSPWGPWLVFQFLNLNTDRRTPWTGEQTVTRSLPARRTAQKQNKRTQKSMPQVRSSGIRTHDPSFRAGEDVSFLRPPGHCDRQC